MEYEATDVIVGKGYRDGLANWIGWDGIASFRKGHDGPYYLPSKSFLSPRDIVNGDCTPPRAGKHLHSLYSIVTSILACPWAPSAPVNSTVVSRTFPEVFSWE